MIVSVQKEVAIEQCSSRADSAQIASKSTSHLSPLQLTSITISEFPTNVCSRYMYTYSGCENMQQLYTYCTCTCGIPELENIPCSLSGTTAREKPLNVQRSLACLNPS